MSSQINNPIEVRFLYVERITDFAPKYELGDALAEAQTWLTANPTEKVTLSITSEADKITGATLYQVRVYNRISTLYPSQLGFGGGK
jgi:hypothetical protein